MGIMSKKGEIQLYNGIRTINQQNSSALTNIIWVCIIKYPMKVV